MTFTTNRASARLTCDRCGYSREYCETSVAQCFRRAKDDGYTIRRTGGGSVIRGNCVCGDCVTIMKKKMEERGCQ
jgi:hypothetical protein